MKKITGLLALILSGIILLSACSTGDSGNTTSDTTTEAGAEDVETTTAAEVNYLETLPKVDLDGGDMRFAAHHGSNYRQNFPEDTENGEPINDALYRRNREIESLYNTNIVNTATNDSGELLNLTRTAILSGEDAYDVIFADMSNTARALTLNGAILSYDKIPVVDLEKEWWNKYNMTDLTLGGKIYFPTGVITPMYFKAPYAMMFNQRLADSFGITSLYDDVDSGKWTIDRMSTLMKDTSLDLNGDGQMNLEDQWALAYDKVAAFAYYVGSGFKMVEYDDEGFPKLTMGSEKSVTALEKLRSIVGDKSTALRGEDYVKNAEFDVIYNGQALFAGQTLVRIALYRDMEDDYGILPMPKYNESQDEYYSYAQPWSGTGVAIPVTNKKLDETGTIVEAMAYLSNDYITTAMYDVTFKAKVSRDPDSERMLDIITESASFDLNVIFNFGSSTAVLQNYVLGNTDEFVSAYAAVEPAALAAIEELRETVLGLDK